jgi:hypothetical protein
MELKYSDYFTIEDLRKRGYDLEADNVLDSIHFGSRDEAIEDFMNNSLRAIYNLFVEYKGRNWADAFFSDMKNTDLTGVALDYQQRLHQALIEQAIYIYDNGDSNAVANLNDRAERNPYAPKAIVEIWDILTSF